MGRSVNVFAIADPLGCLNPGEVHLVFSETFIDDQSGSEDIVFHDVELVVGRQPALGGSDMRSKGVFPLAESRECRMVITTEIGFG